MFKSRIDRPVPKDDRTCFVFEGEMLAFGWMRNQPGWIIVANANTTDPTLRRIYASEDEIAEVLPERVVQTISVFPTPETIEPPVDVEQTEYEPLPAADALTGFVAWLTTRQVPIVMGRDYDAGRAASLLKEFIETNDLDDVTSDFPNNYNTPSVLDPPLLTGNSNASLSRSELEDEVLQLRRQTDQRCKGKSALIWHNGNGAITFYISDDDMAWFDGCYLNWMPYDYQDIEGELDRQQKLSEVMNGIGTIPPQEVSNKLWRQAVCCGANVVVVGVVN